MNKTTTKNGLLDLVARLSKALETAIAAAKERLDKKEQSENGRYRRREITNEIKGHHSVYVSQGRVEKNAKDLRERARDTIGDLLGWEETELLDGPRKVATLQNRVTHKIDYDALKRDFPEVVTLLENYKRPVDCWTYIVH